MLKASIFNRAANRLKRIHPALEEFMRSTSALLFAALAITAATATTAWAGSLGNGAAQWNKAYGNKPAMQPQKQTTYGYCYGRNQHTEYFSAVFPLAGVGYSDVDGGQMVGRESAAFRNYLTGMTGSPNDGECRGGAATMAAAVAAKQEAERSIQEVYHNRQIVETDWAGH